MLKDTNDDAFRTKAPPSVRKEKWKSMIVLVGAC